MRINVSKSLVTSFEAGRLVPQDDTAKALDAVFGTGNEIQRLAKAEREDRQPWMRSWLEHERRAALIRHWDLALVPGLLQCEGYMREVFTQAPGGGGEVDDLVRARRERQAGIFERRPAVELSFLIGEMALRQGPRDILKDQLEHLVDASHRPNIRIRLVPDAQTLHVGLGGSIGLATLTDGRRIGRLDDPLEGKVVTAAADLIRCELALEAIDGLALSVAQSRDQTLERISGLK